MSLNSATYVNDPPSTMSGSPQLSQSGLALLRDFDLQSHKILSTDVFDTLLLRKPIAERHRLAMIAERFAKRAQMNPQAVLWTRRQAQQASDSVRRICGGRGEVRLADLHRRQAELLALDESFLPLLLEAELDVEKQIVVPNWPLINDIRTLREKGIRVIAISDTPLSETAVSELIDHVAGPKIVDRVYASADANATKRKGLLFGKVLKSEKVRGSDVFHVGDDERADLKNAGLAGLSVAYVPRPRSHTVRRKLDTVGFEVRKARRTPAAVGQNARAAISDPEQYGREILGPIVTEACLMLWLHLRELQRENQPLVLYCARGGLRIRHFLERVAAKFGLPMDVAQKDFMVSRLTAARAALEQGSEVAFREIARLFDGKSVRQTMETIVGTELDLPSSWDQTITYDRLVELYKSESGAVVRQHLSEKNAVFRRYVQSLTDGFERLTLVDTGTYGVTLQLLMDAFPERDWRLIHLVRSRDARGSAPHFSRTAGVLVERDGHSPFDRNSVILRYWLLMECQFEPNLPSVAEFSEADGDIRSNLETPGWEEKIAQANTPFVAGILDYMNQVEVGGMADQIDRADAAWRRLKKDILFPNANDVALLDIGERPWNFGRSDSHPVMKPVDQEGLSESLRNFWLSPWSEGYAVRAFPRSYPLFHVGLRLAFYLRQLKQSMGYA